MSEYSFESTVPTWATQSTDPAKPLAATMMATDRKSARIFIAFTSCINSLAGWSMDEMPIPKDAGSPKNLSRVYRKHFFG
jgi:hypothetical protein